ncbi:hypothetical protein FGB62_27g13 [Gracilaria domingensis]|nr:hypothetical protein FGB62_27g13 [Gracilaria domingensis]
MGLHNVLRGTKFDAATVGRWLHLSVIKDWSVTSGYLWFNPRTETFPAMPRMANDPHLLTHRLRLDISRPSWSFPGWNGFAARAILATNPSSYEQGTKPCIHARDQEQEKAALQSLQQVCRLASEPPPSSVLEALIRSRTRVEHFHGAERVIRGDTLGMIDLLLFMSDLTSVIVEQHVDAFGDSVIDEQASPPATVLRRMLSASRNLITAQNRSTAWFCAVRAAVRSRGAPTTVTALDESLVPAMRSHLGNNSAALRERFEIMAGGMGAVRSGAVPVLQPDGTIEQFDRGASVVQPNGTMASTTAGVANAAEERCTPEAS